MTRVISILLFIVALFFIHQGWFNYTFWENNAPGSGFIPLIAGLVLAVFTLNIFIKNDKKPFGFVKKQLYPFIGSLIMIISIYVLGMILSIAIFIIAWLIIIEKYSTLRASIYGITTTSVIYIIFKISLKVPLPEGFVGF
ncbi:tripartite tricarboxylate transporter TctB family protein [Fredinandcohnia sp. FSL W7-1320]|uniref:tripartite tricarboxylate transporter TctB family protein n=1 Tax=Fredinandcohnia sp. FSL W7-1320 TaxID=2954540 RepID=UPI0030FDAB1E